MKKGLFSLLLFLGVCFHAIVLAQETKPKQISDVIDRSNTAIEMTIVGNKIFTENAPIGKKIEIFSVVGLKVSEIEIKTPSGEYILSVPKGYYILKINDANNTVRKVAIR